jgi:uncharacterized protein
MSGVTLQLNDRKRGRFYVEGEPGQFGEMEIAVSSTDLVVYHTEVSALAEGKGLAKQLFDTMVAYAREHTLQVVPLCQYVRLQFERRPDEYRDLWTPKKADT